MTALLTAGAPGQAVSNSLAGPVLWGFMIFILITAIGSRRG